MWYSRPIEEFLDLCRTRRATPVCGRGYMRRIFAALAVAVVVVTGPWSGPLAA